MSGTPRAGLETTAVHAGEGREGGAVVTPIYQTAMFLTEEDVPYHDIRSVPDELDAGRPIAVVCSSGQRSGVAASLLLRHGAEDVVHVVDGGVGTWEDEGWPVSRDGAGS